MINSSIKRKLSAFSYDIFLRVVVLIVAFSLVASSFLAPVRQSLMGFPNGDSIYRVLSLVCHQLPSRSFWLFGFPCGLCSRCLLGYIGIAVAALFIRHPRKYSRRFLLGTALLVPGIVDGLIQLETNYESANLMRAITGLIGGMGLFMLLYPLGFQNSLIKKGVSSMKFLSTPPVFGF